MMTKVLMLIILSGYHQGGMTSQVTTLNDCYTVKAYVKALGDRRVSVHCVKLEPE